MVTRRSDEEIRVEFWLKEFENSSFELKRESVAEFVKHHPPCMVEQHYILKVKWTELLDHLEETSELFAALRKLWRKSSNSPGNIN